MLYDLDVLVLEPFPGDLIILTINVLFHQATKEGATGVRVQPADRYVAVWHLYSDRAAKVTQLPKFVQAPLIDKLKSMAELDVTGENIPQTGTIHIRFKQKDYNLMVRVTPSDFGEVLEFDIQAPCPSILTELSA